jgi:hypothetical protein
MCRTPSRSVASCCTQLHETLEVYTALLKACARHDYTPPAVVEELQGAPRCVVSGRCWLCRGPARL